MKPLNEWKINSINYVFSDIDDTMTHNGLLSEEAYSSLWALKRAGIKVIPITGRPAGWCEMIARTWPVDGVIGENGGLYFRYKNKNMFREFVFDKAERDKNKTNLEKVKNEVLSKIPGVAIASDQFCRLMDLAIDFCEDVNPLPKEEIVKIVKIFETHGATAKISSIHVNGWFGNYDKLSMCRHFLQKEFQLDITNENNQIAFFGDSPNDEPMFDFFNNSIGVANVLEFAASMSHLPKYITQKKFGNGFQEGVHWILQHKKT